MYADFAQLCTKIKQACTNLIHTCSKIVHTNCLKGHITPLNRPKTVRISDIRTFLSRLAMYCADYVVVIKMNKSAFLQTIQYIIHRRRTCMQHRSKASLRTPPPFFLTTFRHRQAFQIRIYCRLTQLQFHLIQHPRLDYKIKRLCHNSKICTKVPHFFDICK